MTRAVREAVVSHARQARPRECCGFLLGARGSVSFVAPMPNRARGTTRYRIADADHLALRRTLRGLEPAIDILGVYHSHPAGRAWPSPRDVADAHYPEWVQIVVGFEPRMTVRAFVIRGGGVEQVRVRLISSPPE